MQNVFNVKWLITSNYNYIYTTKGRHLFMNQKSIDINIICIIYIYKYTCVYVCVFVLLQSNIFYQPIF